MSRGCEIGLVVLCLAALAPHAHGQTVLPSFPLPPEEPATSIWFRPADLPTLAARRQDPLAGPAYTRMKAFVDARLTLAGLDDDGRAQVAKGAALLHQLGDTTPAGASYRDVAVRALRAVGPKTAPSIFGQGGNLVAHYDAGPMQSMAEARDLLRGTGVTATDLTAIEQRIGLWADAFLQDPFLQFRDNNIEAKSGAALVTTALAMAGDRRAAGWLANGLTMLNSSLAPMVGDTGFYREGPSYATYTLNNLLPTAYQVRRLGVDWFTPLRPLIETALVLRTPAGDQVPYEDAVPQAFPWLFLAPAFAGDPFAETLRWASEPSGDLSGVAVQQNFDATAFLVLDSSIVPVPPSGSATAFVAGDAHLIALRTGYDLDALQMTMATALDYSSLMLIPSRHNHANPLDLTIAAFGEDLLVTSTGGPEITRSANRAVYLDPASCSTVLVHGTAPFVLAAANVTTDVRLDARDTLSMRHGFIDIGRTSVLVYTGTNRVRRTIALMDGPYAFVVDEVEAPSDVPVSMPWRGRGTRTLLTTSADRIEATWEHTPASPSPPCTLDLIAFGSAPLAASTPHGLYASGYGTEEVMAPVVVESRLRDGRVLALLGPRRPYDAALAASRISAPGNVIAASVFLPWGDVDTIAAGTASTIQTVASITATDAELIVARERGNDLIGIAVVAASFADVRGIRIFEANPPATMALHQDGEAIVISIAEDQGPFDLALHAFTDLGREHTATWNGSLVAAPTVAADAMRMRLQGGGVLRLVPGGPRPAPSTGPATGGSAGARSGGGCSLAPDAPNAPETDIAIALLILMSVVIAGRGRRHV